ncbi:DUF1828 domain-containing protein [Paracoccus versutus]|uniref:DUF1828 domain-containing protein n=2 Tax=Paracoccus versutus TaxID=34007 RepID=UPI002478DA24|nr:DUF1828 domain-containing protein [Paracoccus versutus]WGR58004.1 DUF1828 domain-containing protein [Paracoccus versutus]
MKQEICHAFCDSISVHEIPGGLGISSTMFQANGDPAGVYAIGPDANGLWRLDDGGWILPMVVSSGYDIHSPQRRDALSAIITSGGLFLDEEGLEIHSAMLKAPEVPAAAVRFFSTISRVADLALWTHERVRSTFKEDVKAKLEASLPEGVTMEIDGVPDDRVKDLRADVVLRSPGVAPVALYLVQSDVPLFEAMLLKSETKGLPGRPRVAALLEKEQSGTAKTRLRAVNRLDAWAIYAGEDDSAVERIREELQHPALN